jgi:hypothetical protein
MQPINFLFPHYFLIYLYVLVYIWLKNTLRQNHIETNAPHQVEFE